uniref:C2H2-type domain-containing protein n=1 Tax=Panagrellus redivivus TaxID=6233 RepID=A0A7E4VWH9_PANRE
MGKASNKVVKGASCSKKVKANSIANPKDNKNEYLKVHVQGQEPLFLPFDANKNVLFKDLRAKLSRASYLVLKKHGETYICDMKDGVIEEPDVEWDGGRVWAIVEPKASKAVSDKANVKRKKILAQLAPANRLPSHLNQIWERFDVSSWEELYASPRFSAPYQCNMARFLEYRNGVIQLFTPIIMRQGPEGFDLFTMFRISEGDYIVCDVLKELLKGSRECSCCNKGFVDELEALRHYFDLEHAYRSRKMFDEPVYVSAILETAREYGVFLPMQEFASADDDTTDSNKTSRSTSESSSVPSSAKALKRVKAEIVDLISPPGSPASNSHLIVRQDLPSFSTPSPVDEPVEAEVHREPSPLPPQAVHQPINEWQQPPVYRLGFNGYTPAMQPPPALPVNRGYGLNPNPIVPNHPVPNANYGRDPSLIRQIPDMTLPPPSVPTFFFAPPPPGPQNGMPPLSRTMHPHNALVINRTQQPESLTPSPRQRRESDAVVPTAQSAYPPERAHPRHDNYEAETPRTSRRRQDSEAVDAKSAQPSQLPKRSTLRNANHESLPTGSKCLPATVQASPPIKKSKHTQENANLPTPASVAKVHISIDTIGPSATPPQAKKSKRTTQNPNTEPIPASVSKVPAPIEVKPAPPSRGQHIIFSSDDEEEVSPPPQPSKPSRPGWKQVLSDSSSDSSDSEDPAVPYRQHLAKKKTPAPSPLTAKRVKVATKSPTPPPAKKSRTTSASDTLATPPSTKKKPASKSKQKSKDPPPVVDMMSDSEASGAPIPESRSGTKQPSMRPAMVPYEDFVPEYKCDLTTPIVTMDGLLEHFKVSSEGALFKLKAFQMPVKIPNFAEFIDYRKFILRNIRSFCIRQRADFPFIFYMFKALKSENIYLADIDKSYAMNCEKCDNSPLTLNHLFSRGHIMMGVYLHVVIGFAVVILLASSSCEAALVRFEDAGVDVNPVARHWLQYRTFRELPGSKLDFVPAAINSRNCYFSPIQCQLPVNAPMRQPIVPDKDVMEKRLLSQRRPTFGRFSF